MKQDKGSPDYVTHDQLRVALREVIADREGLSLVIREAITMSKVGPEIHPTKEQREALENLGRLQESLRGPQRFLQAAGNFTRPAFPPRDE